MKKSKFSRLLDNKKFNIFISVLAACLIWFTISLSDESNITKTISGVPVDFNYNASTYKNAGLDIIDMPQTKVNLEIRGPAKDIGSLSAKDFIVYPNVNSVVSEGTKELSLLYTTTKPNVSYKIISCSESSVSVTFEKVVTQKFTVEPDMSQVTVKPGYVLDKGTTTPAEVYISGPMSRVSLISKVTAIMPGALDDLSESKISSATLRLYDANGVELDQSLYTIDTQSVEINIPVLKKETLPLNVEFINVPQGLDVNILKYSLSANSLKVAVPTGKSNVIDSLCVGYIDFRSIDLSEPVVFEVELPEGYINLENVNEVTLTFDTEDFETKSVTVTDINVINVPQNYTVSVETQRIYNVELVGEKEELDGIYGNAVVAQVDASELTLQKGQQNVQVQIIVPSSGGVFATGKYTVIVNVDTAS